MYSKNIINDLKSCSKWQRGPNFVGSEYLIIAGVMFYISEPTLVSKDKDCMVPGSTLLGCLHKDMAPPPFIKAKSKYDEINMPLDSNFLVIPVRTIANKVPKDFLTVQRKSINEFYNGNLNQPELALNIEPYWEGSFKRAIINRDIKCGSLIVRQSEGL